LNSYTKSYDHGQLAQKHKQTAANLWLIRERYLNLITDIVMGERPIEALQKERDLIMSDLHSAYTGAPATTSKAYASTQRALQRDEDLTFSDEEIDAFLPKELKKSRRGPAA
jgi:SMODS and SLOG-associating 2TM effector domain family 4